MCRQFTSGILLMSSLLLGACANMSIPLVGSSEPAMETATSPVAAELRLEQVGPAVNAPVGIVVETPPLHSGNQALFDRAVALIESGQLDAAEVLLLELTSDQPELAGPWVNLGHIYLASERPAEAEKMFLAALDANPHNCGALNQLGVMARRQGRFGEAEAYYQRCIDAAPLYPHAHLNLAILYELYMGRLGEALAAYNDYQVMLSEPDARVSGWVMDLERRVAAIATR